MRASGSGKGKEKGRFWLMLPIAIGLHIVALMWPMPPRDKPEVVQKRLKSVPIVAASPVPKPTPTPTAQPLTAPIPPLVRDTPPSSPAPAASPTALPPPSPSLSPSPNPSPSPSPSPNPNPAPSPSKSPLPDGLQLTDATPCQPGSVVCFRVAEANGRDVSIKLEDQLLTKGFSLSTVDLANDTGRKAYEVAKDGEVKYYLFMTWDSRGTVYEKFLTRGELDAKAAAS